MVRRRLLAAARLAIADLRHSWLWTLCIVILIASVMVPVLFLDALRNGIVGRLQVELHSRPDVLGVRLLGSGTFSPTDLDAIAAFPETGFVAGLTREISARAVLEVAARTGTAGRARIGADLVPTGHGDPVLGGVDPMSVPGLGRPLSVVVSASVAQQLGLEAGSRLDMLVSRQSPDGKSETFRAHLDVAAVLKAERDPEDRVYVSPPLLEAAERFRLGWAMPSFGIVGDDVQFLPFASFRVYAKSIDQIEPLVGRLKADKRFDRLQVRTNSPEIASIRQFDSALTGLVKLLDIVGIIGLFFALSLSFISNTIRMEPQLAVLRVLGYTRQQLAAMPTIQAVLLSVMASGLAVAVDAALCSFTKFYHFDRLQLEVVAEMSWRGTGAVLVSVGVVALVSAALASWRARAVHPSLSGG